MTKNADIYAFERDETVEQFKPRPYVWRNARIGATHLGFEDHGIFTFSLTLEDGATGQGFGGYGLSYERDGERLVNPLSGKIITEILRVVGVDRWEALKGCYVRAGRDESLLIRAIQHITDDNRVLDMKAPEWQNNY